MHGWKISPALLAIGCGSGVAPAPEAKSVPARVTATEAEPEQVEPPAWGELVDRGAVYSRSTAARLCDDGEAPYYLPRGKGRSAPDSEKAQDAGCRFVSDGVVHGLDDFEMIGLRRTFCCPDFYRSAPGPHTGAGSGCRAAEESYEPRDASDAAAAGATVEDCRKVLNVGAYFTHCEVPDTMTLHLCVAVAEGAAQGVTVLTIPNDQDVGSCVADAARELEFPAGTGLSVAVTTFRPATE